MGKIRTFRGSRDNIVRPLGLGQKIKSQEPDDAADETSPELDSLAVAGAPAEVVAEANADEAITDVEIIDEQIEDSEDDEAETEVDLDELDKPALQELAEELGVDSSGRIDHLRSRIRKSLKEG